MPDIYASFDKPVVEKDRPFWSDTYEVGRQIGAGVAVDLPRMVGQGIRRVSRDGGMVDELARSVVESADERAAGWEPDMRGRGLVAETLIKGGRAVGPMGPAIAASLNPFGIYTGPAVAGALFGTSAAQNTEDKLRLQGVPDDRATEAGIYTGLVQGPSEAVGTALGLRFMKAAAPLNPFAKPPGMGGFVERATDTAVLKPFAQNFGLNLLGQPATEVAQDGTTELIERGYGAAPEDLWDIAKNSAQSAVGLTAMLGPFGAASQVGVSRRNEALRGALQSEDPTTRLAAIDALTTQAKKQGVAPAEIEAWRVEQLQPPAPPTRGPATNLLDGADSNDLIGGAYSPLSNPLMYGQTADGRSVTSTLTPETTDPKELVARHADIGRFLGSIEKKLQELQPQYEAAVASGDRAAQARIQNLRSELQKSGFAANDEYNQLDPLVQRYLAENYESEGLFAPRYASTSGQPSNLIHGGISFADAESINVPTQFRPEFVEQSLGLRFPQPGATKSRMSDVEAALSEPTDMYAVSQPDQYEQRLDAGQVAALQAGQLEDDANKQAEAKYAAKRTAATDTLVDKEPDGTLPIKVKPREIETHDTLTALKEAGTITSEVYTDLIGKMRDAIKNNYNAPTLSAVAREVKKLATPAPVAPAAPAVTTAPVAPTAPTEPVNQLLQGQPDVSNAAMVGRGSEQRGTGGGVVAGAGVAPAGRAADAAVGNNPAADGVADVGGQAGAVPNGQPGAAPTVNEATPDIVTGVGNPNTTVTTKKTRKAALGTDERRADILARIQAAKTAPSALSGTKLKQGGAIDVGLLSLYAELAADHIVRTGKNFAEFTRRMVADLGEEVEPYLRRLHTAAQDEIRKTVKPVAVERTPDGAPVMLESRDADGKVVGYTVKLKGKAGAYLRRDAQSGQLVLVPERSGLTKQDSPVYLGENLDEALDELPFAYGLLKSGRKIAEASGKTAVEFEPKNKAVVGGAIDFNLLHQATEGKPQYLKSIYLYLGIDKDGTRLMGKPMSANAAAREGGWGKNSGQNLTKAVNALGITDDVMNRFMQSDQMALPLPGESVPLSIRERLEQGAEQEEEGRDQYVDDTADDRDEDTRQIEEGVRGAGAFEDDSNIGTEDSSDGSVLERFNEGISTISSVGGSTMGTEKPLTTRVSASKQFKALAEAIKQKLPLDSFPTEELLAGFHKVSKHILPDQLDGSESQTVIDNAYANEAFMFGTLESLKEREQRAQGSASAKKQLYSAYTAYTKALEKDGSLIRDDKKGRSKTTADRDEEFVAGLERDEKGNLNEASNTESTGPTDAESLFDSGRDANEEADRAIEERLGDADTANDGRDNEDRSRGKTKFGKAQNINPDGTAKDPYTAEKLSDELTAFVRTGSLGTRVVVVDSVDDLINSDDDTRHEVGRRIKANGAFAAVHRHVAYMIADRINKGEGTAKFLHEVGAHLGMEGLLGEKRLTALSQQIRNWATSDANTQEVILASKAMQRVIDAGTSSEQTDSELIAYFVEEAVAHGISPTAADSNLTNGPLRQWFRTLWAAFKVAVRTLGIKPENLTAKNVVDLAYGAARLEVNGVFHGTAASFRRFSHEFMGEGEGAQAFGWGTYLAQASGIANEYFVNDVGRKTFQAASKVLDGLTGDLYLSGPVLDPETMQEIFPAGTKLSRGVRRRLGQLHLERGIDSVTVETADGPVELDLTVNPPKGNLLRVDTAVAPDEMLDWNTSLSKQPAIREKVQQSIPQDLLDQVFEETNTDIDDITGEDLYRGLTFLEKREGLVSEFAEKDTIHKDAQRTVSEYLDSIGIKGLQYLDNPSRKEKDPAQQTRNVVVFNDRNIQRVLSKVGNSRSNIQFGSSTVSNAATMGRSLLGNLGVWTDGGLRLAKIGAFGPIKNAGVDFEDSPKSLKMKVYDLDILAKSELGDALVETFVMSAKDDGSAEIHTQGVQRRDGRDVLTKYGDAIQSVTGASGKTYLKFAPGSFSVPDLRAAFRTLRDESANHPVLSEATRITIARDTGANGGAAARTVDMSRAMKFGIGSSTASNANTLYRNTAERLRANTNPKVADSFATVTDFLQKNSPRFLNNSQLAEQYGQDPKRDAQPGRIKALSTYVGLQQSLTVERTKQAMEFHDIAVKWDKLAKAIKTQLSDVMLRATLKEIHPDRAFGEPENAHLKPEQQADHAALAAKYNAMTPDAKKVYQEAKQSLADAWKKREAAYNQLVDYTYNKRIEAAQERGDTDAVAKLTKEKEDSKAEYSKQLKQIKGPYFPLMRFGSYLAIGESQALIDLRQRMDDATGSERSALEKQLDAMKKDGTQYSVSAHETKGQANAAERALKAKGLQTRQDLTDQHIDGMRTLSQDTLDNITQVIDSQFDKGTAGKLNESISSIFLQTLPEMHALRREAHRKGIEGASPDMLRAFSAAGQQGAFFTSRLMYASEMADTMFAMKRETKGKSDLQHIHREMEQRMALDMQYKPTPVQDLMSSLSWVYHLGVSPSFMLINSTQPWLVTLPMMAGKFGITKATKALSAASRDALMILKDARWKDGQFDAWTGISEGTLASFEDRKAIRELMTKGVLADGAQHDLGTFAEDSSRLLSKVNRYMGWTTQQIELLNRTSSALASFRLARKDGMNYDDAVKYAYDTTLNTQFDYSSEGTARVMREGGGVPFAKLAFQFRRYQQGMLYLFGSNIKKAFGEGKEAKEARAALTYFTLTSGMAAGALGLPFMSTALFIANLFGDPDDPEGDAETKLRNALYDMSGDKRLSDVLAKGVPAMFGMDLSKRIGLGDIASPFPMARFDKRTGQEQVGELVLSALGPAAGMAAKFYDGFVRLSEGDIAKGIEKLSPKFVADVVKAGRFATEGLTDGKNVPTGTEMDAWDVTLRALGVSPTAESAYYEGTNAIKNIEAAYKERQGSIGKVFKAGVRSGDMGDVRELIQKFNEDHPEQPITGKQEMQWRKDVRGEGKNRAPGSGVPLMTKNEAYMNRAGRFAQ